MEKENTSKSGTDIIKDTIIPDDILINKIHVIRDQKVMLDSDLAELYGVETKVLNQAVRRNIVRFPSDFMFELTQQEYESLRSQIVTLNKRGAHSKYLPNVFTEQGVAMLSSVLRSPQAIQVNIQIMRIFTRIRQMLMDNAEIWREIFEYIDRLQEKVEPSTRPKRNRIGFEVGREK